MTILIGNNDGTFRGSDGGLYTDLAARLEWLGRDDTPENRAALKAEIFAEPRDATQRVVTIERA